MDPLSITVSVSTLLVTAAKVIKAASTLRSQYKDAVFMLSAISSECTVINTSLAILQSLMLSDVDRLRSRMTDDIMSTFEVGLLGCALTMSVVEDELSGLLVLDKDGSLKPRRIKYMRDQDHLKEMLQQIRGQQIGVSLLLQTYQAETTAEVSRIAHKNHVLLRQIANRGRSFYLESIHDGEKRAAVAQSFRTDGISDYEMCSIVDDRQFDFDDEIINAGAYRRALATLQQRSKFQEDIGETSPPANGGGGQPSDAGQAEFTRTVPASIATIRDYDTIRDTKNSSTEEDAVSPDSTLFERQPPIRVLEAPEQDFEATFGDLHWMFPRSAPVPRVHLDPRTNKPMKGTEGPKRMTDAQMQDLEQKALHSRGVRPLLQSTTDLKSKAEIEAMMKNDRGNFGLKGVGGSKVTAEQLRQEPMKFRKLKFVVLGDGAAGKTYAIMKYLRGHTDGIPYAPTVYANYVSDIKVDGYHCQVNWEDTTGQEDYDQLRTLAYPQAHVALLVFSIDSPDSLNNILEKWQAEIFHFLPRIPKIVVGTKSDLRNDAQTIEELKKKSQAPISRKQGEEVVAMLGKNHRQYSPKIKYMECSSYTGEGITEVFEEAARLGIEYTNMTTNKKPKRLSDLFKRSKGQQPSPEEVSEERPPEEGSPQNPNNFRIVSQGSSNPIV